MQTTLPISIKIEKKICIGMIISGAMAYFEEESKSDKNIIHIEQKLYNKHFPMRNGSASDRERLKKIAQKKKFNHRDLEYIERAKILELKYTAHNKIADRSWKKLQESVGSIDLTMNALIYSLLYKSPETIKYYGINREILQLFLGLEQKRNKFLFNSLKVSNMLLKILDEEIENSTQEVIA